MQRPVGRVAKTKKMATCGPALCEVLAPATWPAMVFFLLPLLLSLPLCHKSFLFPWHKLSTFMKCWFSEVWKKKGLVFRENRPYLKNCSEQRRCGTYTQWNISHKKRKSFHCAKWTDLEGVMLCEISQTENNKYHLISFMSGLLKVKQRNEK